MEVIILNKKAIYLKEFSDGCNEYIVRKEAIATIDFVTYKDSSDKEISINVIAENENICINDFTDEEEYESIKETLLEWMKM